MEYQRQLETIATGFRVLTFRSSRDELVGLDHRHLALGLAATWLVGMGRHWDAANATVVQSLGLVSVVFVVGLAAVVWVSCHPFGPANWSYRRVLTFMTLAALPALVYAIPVERMFSLGAAQAMNAAFLALVSLWRLSLLVFFLSRLGEFSISRAMVIALLPVSIVVVALTAWNTVEHAAVGGISFGGM